MTFGDKIKMLRKQKGFTQKELSKETGVPFYTIVALENDRSKIPLITTVLKFSSYFNLSVESLIRDVRFEVR